MQKGFSGIIILIVILILAGLAGAYYFGKTQVPKPQPQTIIPSSSPDETANWKTYTNNKYKYQFKYPPAWEQTLVECSGPDTTACLDMQQFSLNNEVRLEVYLELERWTDGKFNYPGYNFLNSVTYNNIPMTIQASNMAGSYGNAGINPFLDLIADFFNLDKTVHFSVSFRWPVPTVTAKPTQDEIQQNLIKFNQILSTFKFTQ